MAYALGAGFGLALLVIAVTAGVGLGGIGAALGAGIRIGLVLGAGLGAGMVLGWAFAGRRWAAFGGLLLGALAWTAAQRGLAAPAPSEWGSLFAAIDFATILVVSVVVTGVGLFVGGFASPHPALESVLVRLLGATGLLAACAYAVTFGVLLYAPASASFEISLPASWHVLPRGDIPWDENIAFGDDYTAVYATTEVPAALDVPVVGVTTVQAGVDSSPGNCYRAMDTWGRPPSPLYDGAIVASNVAVDLPVGPAYSEVRAGDNSGSAVRVYGYGIVRGRQVGMLPEKICYILAITVPPGGVITEADARAIAESFRFR